MMGRLQFWLQGFPDGGRGRVSVALGNALSEVRFFTWWLRHPEDR